MVTLPLLLRVAVTAALPFFCTPLMVVLRREVFFSLAGAAQAGTHRAMQQAQTNKERNKRIRLQQWLRQFCLSTKKNELRRQMEYISASSIVACPSKEICPLNTRESWVDATIFEPRIYNRAE